MPLSAFALKKNACSSFVSNFALVAFISANLPRRLLHGYVVPLFGRSLCSAEAIRSHSM